MTIDGSSPAPVPAVLEPAPVVSVIVLAYNHERYIAESLDSALSQRDAPAHEILVAEDCSPDKTRAIVDEIAARNPHRLRRLPRERNLGLSANLEDAFRQCRGKYIAILEGDDAWCDAGKLHKVVAALEAHPEWTGCFHATRQVCDRLRFVPPVYPVVFPSRPVEFDDLLSENLVPSYSSVTYRRGLVTSFPEWHGRYANGDWALHMLHAAHGPIGFLPEIMTAYRVHDRGMWTSLPLAEKWRQQHAVWSAIDRQFDGRYADRIQAARGRFLSELAAEVEDLRRIEHRYHVLQLDHLAAALRPLQNLWQRWTSPPR